MRIAYITLMLSFISTLVFASTDRPSGNALEWWLRGQGKFNGAKINTHQTSDGKYEIYHWEANGVPQPTDSELETIINDYEKEPKVKSLEERVSDLEKKVK